MCLALKLFYIMRSRVLNPLCGACQAAVLPESQQSFNSILRRCLQPDRNLTDKPEAAGTGREEEEDEHMLDLTQSSEEETDPTAPEGECPYCALHEYPTNNMVTGYTSARDMRKYVGELHDFIPGTSGYTVYWIKQKINIFCDAKTRMKRKL